MTGEWKVDTYQTREREWRQKAENAASAEEREGCLVIADGYANLVVLLTATGLSAEATTD
jgi:hypothetical protein